MILTFLIKVEWSSQSSTFERKTEVENHLASLSSNAGKVQTAHPFNEEKVAHYLCNHPDKAKFKLIIIGSSIGLKKDNVLSKLSRRVNNMIFSRRDLDAMLDRIIKTLKQGFIAPGAGWYQLNLLCVPKKNNETGLMTEIRVACHAPGSIALNDANDESQKGMKGELTLPTFLDYLWFFLQVC